MTSSTKIVSMKVTGYGMNRVALVFIALAGSPETPICEPHALPRRDYGTSADWNSYIDDCQKKLAADCGLI